MSNETIAAIGTALSNSGISIIRISGNKSLDIISKIFVSKNILEPNKIIYGNIIKDNIVMDNVLVSYFKSPKSFTGEDICEINCHGGNEITREILELVLDSGAVLAQPGEFSKRAFLNGKMDLSKAEAVIDVITAKTRTEARIATNQLKGNLSCKIKSLREELVELLAQIEVGVDYPEYDYEEIQNEKMLELLQNKINEINYLLDTYEQGKIIKEGINVAILGRPNVGKSSLLNLLANCDKAIVTDIAGTTRDIVDAVVNIDDIILNISDTAGLRDTKDQIEKIGVEKSIKKIDEVDLVIYMLNAAEKVSQNDLTMLSKIKNKGVKSIATINKTDKIEKSVFDTFLKELEPCGVENMIFISVKNKIGIENLKKAIISIFNKNDLDYEHEVIIMNARHKNLLKNSVQSLQEALNEINNNKPIDIVSIYIKDAANLLGQIIGTQVSQDIIDKIFEKFCVGK